MLIDMHVHVAPDDIGLVRAVGGSRFPTPAELLAMMDAAGIDKAAVMSSGSPEYRYRWSTPEDVIEICRRHADRLIPFANLDPRMLTNSAHSDFTPLLAYYKQLGCRGIGEYIPNIPLDDPLNINLFKQVGEAGLPLTFHLAPQIGGFYGCYDEMGLPRLENVLQQCPKTVFLGHSQPFWAEISRDVTPENRSGYPGGPVIPGRLPDLMRRYPNLHGDLSAGSGCNAIRRDRDFGLAFLEEFQDRLYFGTDIANVPQKMPLVECFADLRENRLISPEAYAKIAWRNAARLLGLEDSGA